MDENLTWWQRLLRTNPAVVKGLIGGIVLVAGVWGLNLTNVGEQVNQTVDVVFTVFIPFLTSVWIRASVYAPATVDRLVNEAASTGVPAVPPPPGPKDLGLSRNGTIIIVAVIVAVVVLLVSGVFSLGLG